MAVDSPKVIDAVGIDNATGEVVLTIADHLEWTSLHDHLAILQDKINSYLGYLESGEMSESYPQGKGRRVRIDIICKHEPPEPAIEFFKKAEPVVEECGASLSWHVPDR